MVKTTTYKDIMSNLKIITSLAELKQVARPRVETVDVEAYGISLYVRGLTGEERGKMMSRGGKVIIRKDESKEIDLSGVKNGDGLLASFGLVLDEAGTQQMYSGRRAEHDASQLPAEILEPVVRTVRELSGMVEDAVEEEKKES